MWGDGDFCHKAIGLLKNVETHINSMGTPGNSNCRPSGGVGGGRGEGLDGTDQVGFGVGREGMSMPRWTPAGTGSRGGGGGDSGPCRATADVMAAYHSYSAAKPNVRRSELPTRFSQLGSLTYISTSKEVTAKYQQKRYEVTISLLEYS